MQECAVVGKVAHGFLRSGRIVGNAAPRGSTLLTRAKRGRQTWVLSDLVSEDWEGSAVFGFGGGVVGLGAEVAGHHEEGVSGAEAVVVHGVFEEFA